MLTASSRRVYLRLRRTIVAQKYARPIYDRLSLHNWWQRGRPTPPPHSVKMQAILNLADRIGASTLVETGTYRGDTIRTLRNRFSMIASIELVPELARPVEQEFARDPGVRILVGDSGKLLKQLLPDLKEPTVFWLDAHYSGGPTRGEGQVPIYAEMDSILELAPARHALLIDDMHEFVGNDGYPTAADLVRKCADAAYDIAVFNNMLHAVSHAAVRQSRV